MLCRLPAFWRMHGAKSVLALCQKLTKIYTAPNSVLLFLKLSMSAVGNVFQISTNRHYAQGRGLVKISSMAVNFVTAFSSRV